MNASCILTRRPIYVVQVDSSGVFAGAYTDTVWNGGWFRIVCRSPK